MKFLITPAQALVSVTHSCRRRLTSNKMMRVPATLRPLAALPPRHQRPATSNKCAYSKPAGGGAMPVKEVRIPVPWGHIAGKWWGSVDAQPTIGVHGWQDNAATFDALVPLLDVDSFLSLDLPGHGLSSHLPQGHGYHFLDQVSSIRRVIKHYKWDKVDFLGHSLGSQMCFAYAACYPSDVTSYVSVDCSRGVLRQETSRFVADCRNAIDGVPLVEAASRKPVTCYGRREMEDKYLKSSWFPFSRSSCEVMLGRGLEERGEGKFGHRRDLRLKLYRPTAGYMSEAMLQALASEVTCHLLSIRPAGGCTVGGNKERIYMATLETMKRKARSWQHWEVAGSHHVHLDTPEMVAPLINAFLAGLMARGAEEEGARGAEEGDRETPPRIRAKQN